jgi:hypothetical protein
MNRLFVSSDRSTRRLVTFGLALLLAGPALLLWASRPQLTTGPVLNDEAALHEEFLRQDTLRFESMVRPAATARPEEVAPFGGRFDFPRVVEGSTAGMILTNLGHVRARDPHALLQDVPAQLQFRPGELLKLRQGDAVDGGLNYVSLSRQALAGRPAEEILGSIQRVGRIVGYLPDATLMVYLERGRAKELESIAEVDAVLAVHPAFKLDRLIGRRPLIERARATSRDLQLEVAVIPGAERAEMMESLRGVRGVRSVVEHGFDGSAYMLKAHFTALADIARLPKVLHVQETLEFMTNNWENAPTLMVGANDESIGIRPFDDAGVDGGGIDTNGDGRRINNGTDQVPPQIVSVTDNGISADSPNFSQTATQVDTLDAALGTPAHRKIHAIHNILDGGTSCDGLLSGAGTHGNVVAAAIAGFPSQVGAFATRSGIAFFGEPFNFILDGLARGARIIVQDVADTSRCTINSLVEKGGNVSPGRLLDRLNEVICPKSGGTGACSGVTGGENEAHLAVMPFGAPTNFSTVQFPATNGTYPQESRDLDVFLYNNRDFMVVAPVGNSGGLFNSNRLQLTTPIIPDLFNGTSADDDPNFPQPIQVSPPATAKNIISVGTHRADSMSIFAQDSENRNDDYTSRGPATIQSLRMAPILMGPSSDLEGTAAGTTSVAVFRSTDNDNLPPVVAQLDEGNTGSSFSAAYVTGAAAIVRDYFAQGFYPTGDRSTSDRVPNASGALVKAALIASANFNDIVPATGQDAGERDLRRTRAFNIGTVQGIDIGVIGNSEQGYGRAVLTQVLPLSNWSKNFVLNATFGPVREHPARGLLVWDYLATGEPLIDNTATTSVTHTFRVHGPRTIGGVCSGGPTPGMACDLNADCGEGGTCPALAIFRGELRIGLAWPDPPSPIDSGGPLVNDLDMTLEGPGPDNCLDAGETNYFGTTCPAGSETDNVFYDGNIYFGGRNNALTDQWSRPRGATGAEIHDRRNPQEGIHINSDPNADQNFADSPLHVGTWRITVKRGTGGAIAGQITLTGTPTTNEDTNGNGRLDSGEDTNGNGLLDLPGQSYALVVSGPVFLAEPAPALGPSTFPQSSISVDKIRYSCSDGVVASIFDSTPGAGAARSQTSTTFTVVNRAGITLDTETGVGFTAGAAAGITSSAPVPVRLSGAAIPNNGILETDSGHLVVATYAPAGQRAVSARGQVQCTPDIIPGAFATAGGNAIGETFSLAGGCDNDDSFDAGETVTYGVALINRNRSDDYADVVATLTPSGPGAVALRVLDSPRNVGRLPASGANGIFFHVFVDPTRIPTNIADRRVTMTLTLDSSSRGQRVSRQTFAFNHAINADRETLHYSTDFPSGGRQVRDLNRNLVIDQADTIDPFRLIVLPDEDITFATMFTSGVPTNTLGEDLNNNGILDPGEDTIPNGILDRGILDGNKVPWTLDQNSGGWVALRHPGSTPANIDTRPVWEYKTSGLCGFQTSGGPGLFGIWHTGDGNPATPSSTAVACENHALPNSGSTAPRADFILDVLHSPIIAKVNQQLDARGFPFTAEFQRFGVNLNIQLIDAYAGGGINIDNNIDNDNANCLLCQQLNVYAMRRFGGWPLSLFRFHGRYFGEDGISPATVQPSQRTFGPFVNPDGSAQLNGDESGFTGNTENTNADSTSPIPTAAPDFLPFPLPGAPLPGVCTGGPTPGGPCQVSTDCGTGGTCTLADNTIAGPIRSFDTTLVGFEGVAAFEMTAGNAAVENFFTYIPGKAGNRWQIGIGFYSIENAGVLADYGASIDDPVFEWDEHHPLDESAFTDGRGAACSRFNQPGRPAGGQCATITVDRTNLFECEEAVEITVVDPKRTADSSIEVAVVTDSDSIPFSTLRFSVLTPNAKRYTLAADPPGSGLFRGTVTFSSTTNQPTNVFTNPGTDAQFIVYYVDPGCDGDGDGAAGESLFDNIDGDGVPFASDSCPFVYNPLQEDLDGDGVGDLCDLCIRVADPGQADANADGIGDACEFDDVDGDGFDNFDDNCPDIYNPDQTPAPGGSGRGVACNATTDLDGDGIADRQDNCVLAPNPTQSNADGDRLGDACDGDCAETSLVFICSNAPATSCTTSADCPSGGVCQSAARHPQGAACSAQDDDADADGVPDDVDNCATIANPPVVAGTFRQADRDRDGIGDACDPTGSLDDDFNGVPDDIVTFTGSNNCRTLPLANLTVLSTVYQDLDGDGDIFPDTGETGRVVVTVRNSGVSLTNATFVLTSSDPDVACVTQPTLVRPSVASGATITLGSLDPLQPGFTFVSSNSLETVSAANPARSVLCLTVTANETLGVTSPACFSLLSDLDTPEGVTQVFTLGPDGIQGTADDGRVLENFDVDKNGDGVFTVADTFLRETGPGTYDTAGPSGFYLRGSDTGVGTNVVAAVACGGFDDVSQGNLQCHLDPDFPMDWHFHCPPGTANCPNVETGTCVGGCTYNTPVNGTKAFTPPNSLHMGAHFDGTDALAGDTSHFRTLQAFVTTPINLALFPRTGDLDLSFFHIAFLMDNNGHSGAVGQCDDCGDVQIQVDLDPDPVVDNWGIWDKLAPFQNVYDHKVKAWSVFIGAYCQFTPTDTGTAPPTSRIPPVHETICFPLGAWSHCGSTTGTTSSTTFNCPGPGTVDPSGSGVWVQTRFNLAGFLGQRVRIRWIGQTWKFGDNMESYFEIGGSWGATVNDDGWWLDNIQVIGTVESQVTPSPDTKPSPGGACPAGCDNTVGDRGTNVILRATDLAGTILDGLANVATAGQAIRVTAVDSTLPGGCVSGNAQFRFEKNGVLAQDWSSKTFFQDSPEATATYRAFARCSSDHSCTSLAGKSIDVAVISGDGGDAIFGQKTNPFVTTNGVLYDRTAMTTTLNWWAPGTAAVDLYRGQVGPGITKGLLLTGPFWQLNTSGTTDSVAACLVSNVSGTPASGGGSNGTSGALTQSQDPNPALGFATYYLVTPNGPSSASVNAQGCANPAICQGGTAPGAFCSTDAQCGAGGTCLNVGLTTLPAGLSGCPSPGNPRRVVRQAVAANVCP